MLAQAGGHVAVALGDQHLVQRRRLLGELGEGTLEDVLFLEALDLVLAQLRPCDEAGHEAAHQGPALPPGYRADQPAQGDADVAVDQPQRQGARPGRVDRGAHLGADLDAELVGQALLVGRQRELGGNHAGAARAHDAEQVDVVPVIVAGQALVARLAQLDGDGLVTAGVDGSADIVGALSGNVRCAQQHDFGLVDHYAALRGVSGLFVCGHFGFCLWL